MVYVKCFRFTTLWLLWILPVCCHVSELSQQYLKCGALALSEDPISGHNVWSLFPFCSFWRLERLEMKRNKQEKSQWESTSILHSLGLLLHERMKKLTWGCQAGRSRARSCHCTRQYQRDKNQKALLKYFQQPCLKHIHIEDIHLLMCTMPLMPPSFASCFQEDEASWSHACAPVDLGPKIEGSLVKLCFKFWGWQLACVSQWEARHNIVKIDSFYISSVPRPSPD